MSKTKNDFSDYDDLELANFTCSQFITFKEFYDCWSELLFSENVLNIPDEHLDRFFCIFFCGVRDIIQRADDWHLHLQGQIMHRNMRGTLKVHHLYIELIEAARAKLSKFTDDEQICINHLRDSYVHGSITGIWKKKFDLMSNVKVVHPDKIIKLTMRVNEFHAILEREISRGVHEFLGPCRNRFFQMDKFFLLLVNVSKPDFSRQVVGESYNDLLLNPHWGPILRKAHGYQT